MKKAVIGFLISLVALFALPNVAQAYGSDTPAVSGTVSPGQTVTVTWPAGTFSSYEDITPVCNCTSGAATLEPTTTRPSVFVALPSPSPYFSNADGSFSIKVTLPNTEFGTCSLTASATSGVATASLAVAPVDLPHTGMNPAPYLWAGAGVIALGIAFVVVFSNRRKSTSKR